MAENREEGGRANPQEQYGYEVTHAVAQVHELIADDSTEASVVGIGGRVVAIRHFGGVAFADVRDNTGVIQVKAHRGETPEEGTPEFSAFTKLNKGDWIGVTGLTGKSGKDNTPNILVGDWATLAATQIDFPNTRQGVRNPDTRARQRYLDLAANPESNRRFQACSEIVRLTRSMLADEDFIEVNTGILQAVYGGANAKPFTTHHNTLDMKAYLRIATELRLKEVVVGGYPKVFELGPDFRNEGMDADHSPEFTMVEIYAAYWDYRHQMALTERLVGGLAFALHGDTSITYQGKAVDLSAPWRRATMDDLVSEATGEEVNINVGARRLRALANRHGVDFDNSAGPGRLLAGLYEATVEDTLQGPIFVTDYPEEISPLARSHRSRPGYTERFEGFVAGSELCNGYTELNDAETQYIRFLEQDARRGQDAEAMPIDHDYVRALMYGLPPTAGLGIGMDRLAMLLTDAPTIRDVILFPLMRPDGFKVDPATFREPQKSARSK